MQAPIKLEEDHTILDSGDHLHRQLNATLPDHIVQMAGELNANAKDIAHWFDTHHPEFDYNTQGRLDITLLIIASIRGNLELIRFLVEEKKVDINRVDKQFSAPLAAACAYGKKDAVSLLLSLGADPKYYTQIEYYDHEGNLYYHYQENVTETYLVKKPYATTFENKYDEINPSPLTMACLYSLGRSNQAPSYARLKKICSNLDHHEVSESVKELLHMLIKAGINPTNHRFFPTIKDYYTEWQARRTVVLMGMFGYRLRDDSPISPLETIGQLDLEHQAIILEATNPKYYK